MSNKFLTKKKKFKKKVKKSKKEKVIVKVTVPSVFYFNVTITRGRWSGQKLYPSNSTVTFQKQLVEVEVKVVIKITTSVEKYLLKMLLEL